MANPETFQNVPIIGECFRTTFLLCNDFVDIDFKRHPALRGIGGITVDIENVLTDGIDGGDSTVRPEALDALGRIHRSGRGLLLVTNCKDTDFVGEVTDQVNQELKPETPILSRTKVQAGKPKVHPEIYYQASNRLRLPGRRMAHVGDQAQEHVGALRAGVALKIWPKPWGENQRKGVRRFRPIEMSIVRGAVHVYPRSRVLMPEDYYVPAQNEKAA